MKHLVLGVACLAIFATGCNVFRGSSDDNLLQRGGLSSLAPADESDPTEDETDEWSFVGNEARGNQMLEKERGDWFFKKYFMSAKANSIERNLGIGTYGE